MKKNAILAILGLATILLVANLFGNWFSFKKEVNDEALKSKKDTVILTKYISKIDSTTHGKFEQNKGEIVNNYITNKYMTYVSDTLVPALNIATSKIDELTRINMNLEGKLKASKTEIDANKKAVVYYQNKYLQIVSNVSDSTIDYKYNAVIDVVNYREKKWLLGEEKNYIDISSPDKNFKINGVEHFKKQISLKPKRWGFGIQGGYYYVPAVNQFYPAFGVGISYNLIRF
ncbi:MAG: DUF6808 domain-containing protein [Chryseobacterium sp.]